MSMTPTKNIRRRRVGGLTERRVSVQLGQDLYDRAEAEAERLRVSTSLLLRESIRSGLTLAIKRIERANGAAGADAGADVVEP